MALYNPDGLGPHLPMASHGLYSDEMCGIDSGTIEEPGETKCCCWKAKDTSYNYVSIITTFTLLTEDRRLKNQFKSRLKDTFQLGNYIVACHHTRGSYYGVMRTRGGTATKLFTLTRINRQTD